MSGVNVSMLFAGAGFADNTDRPTWRTVPYIPRRFLKKIECDSLIDQLSTRINVRFVAKVELNTAHTASRPHT